MATMLFDRIVPSGNNAYFPFQMSAASLNPTATIYEANDSTGADSALGGGVSVDDMGGGLYAVKVLSANMTADKMYYGVVTAGSESVRIPLWAYAPTKHTAELITKVDALQADLDNGTDGLGALKALIDTVDSVADAILADTSELQADWANGGRLDLLLDRTVVASEAAEDLIGLSSDNSAAATVFGKIAKLSADLTTEVNANETKIDTIDGVVDDIKAEIGDVSAVFGGGSPPATVAAALKVIYDAQVGIGDVWDDAVDGTEGAGTAGKRLYDLSEDLKNGGRLDLIFDETAADAEAARVSAASADTKLGSPTGASISADLAAIKAVVDTLQVTTNARLAPAMPSEIYSAASAFRVALGLSVYEGTSGALEDPNVLGTNGNANGQALIKAKTVDGGSDPTLYDAASAGSALGTTDASGLTSWYKMVRSGTGKFGAYAEIPAYFNNTVEVSFYCEDSDPNTVQKFETSRYMRVRSPVQASLGGGAF